MVQHRQFQFLTGLIDKSLAYEGSYNVFLVLLSVFIASFAAFSALLITEKLIGIKDKKIKRTWLMVGAFAMGVGIWSMHFIGMLAFKLPIEVGYDPVITAISAIPAVVASWIALHFMCQDKIGFWKLNLGGILMGIGIGTMHYTGMAAMVMSAKMFYDPMLFMLSIVVAHILATFSLFIKFASSQRNIQHKYLVRILSSFIMGCAVAGMHYTGMKAAFYFPVDGLCDVLDLSLQGVSPSILAFMVVSIATILISFVILGVCVRDGSTFRVQYPLSMKVSIGFGALLVLFLFVQISVQSNMNILAKQYSDIIRREKDITFDIQKVHRWVGSMQTAHKDFIITGEKAFTGVRDLDIKNVKGFLVKKVKSAGDNSTQGGLLKESVALIESWENNLKSNDAVAISAQNEIMGSVREKINVYLENEKIQLAKYHEKAQTRIASTRRLGYTLM
ncbi:MAG: hypothetical protein K8I00_09670, partial [Candidatus Omnitrophica bacterium]|nr:hypothetical protein [Candidatus Omnitrophota bacterium]